MLRLKSFSFNPFAENTYVVYNDEREAWIVDPGNSTPGEDRQLSEFISSEKLRPTKLLLTHGHIDHIMGNKFVFESYGLKPVMHRDDLIFVQNMKQSAAMYGLSCEPSPQPDEFIENGAKMTLGSYEFECILAPGHSPGSICFFHKQNGILISGDVLFQGSIGRTDLLLGDHDALISSLNEKIIPLGEEVKVYPGHGPATTIGAERKNNPFLNGGY